MIDETFVSTSLARRLISRMQMTHERRRISVFAGPPGIGKTTAIDEFRKRNPDNVVIVKVARRNAQEVLVLQHVNEAVRGMYSSSWHNGPSSLWHLRNRLFDALCRWARLRTVAARKGAYVSATFDRYTIVFDEAQNISRQAIEGLRYWNDADRCYAPFPVGLVFVGNSEFSLSVDADGQSPISAAVADRTLYSQAFEYDDLTDDDLRLFIEARGLVDEGAVAAILRYFHMPRVARSLRRVSDLLEEVFDAADGEVATAQTVRSALSLS